MLKNFVSFLHFLATILNFGFCFLILRYSVRQLSHLFLAGIAFFSGVYPLSILLSYVTQNPFWARLTHIGYFIPFFFVLFTLALKQDKYLKVKAFFYFLPLPFILYLALFTNLIIYDINLRVFPTTGAVGPLDFIGRIYLIILLTIGISNLIMIYQRSKGFQKVQLKYFSVGATIYTFVGLITTGALPLTIPTSPFINFMTEFPAFFSIFWIGLSSYAVLRYRLFDIRIVISKVIIYLTSFTIVINVGVLIVFLNNQLKNPLPFNVIAPFIGVVSVLLAQLIRSYEKIGARYLYPTFYNTQIAIKELEEKITQSLELGVLCSLLLNTLKNTLKLEKIGIIAKKAGEEEYVLKEGVKFKEKELILFTKDNFLLSYLEKRKKPLIREELALFVKRVKGERKKDFQVLQQKMERIGVSICLPLIFEKKVIGIIILGEKTSKDVFTSQDIELLSALSYQASVALKNATLYSELSERKEELEKFYRLTVGRELTIRELKKKVKELEKELKRGK